MGRSPGGLDVIPVPWIFLATRGEQSHLSGHFQPSREKASCPGPFGEVLIVYFNSPSIYGVCSERRACLKIHSRARSGVL